MSLNVAIPDTYSGPLDLLLYLIRRDEMDIHDIPIARLASAYFEEMRSLALVDVDEAAEFLDLASRLLEIKARMLLPPEEATEGASEEDEGDLDPRSGLVEALLEYRRFKEAALLLGDLAVEQSRRFPRVAPRLEFPPEIFEKVENADVHDLMEAFQAMLYRIVPAEESTEFTYSEIPTSVRIDQIESVLLELGKTRFSMLLSSDRTRIEMISYFIAVLEMIRQGRLIARQAVDFSDIVLERAEPRRAKSKAGIGAGGAYGRGVAVAVRRSPRVFPPAPVRKTASGVVRRKTLAPVGLFPVRPGAGMKIPVRKAVRAPRFFC